jgi:VWFA-related protein
MFINARIGFFLLAPLLYSASASAQRSGAPAPQSNPQAQQSTPSAQQSSPSAQQSSTSSQRENGRIYLDVVVTPKSGPPVAGLEQQDFTLLDNKAPQTITSFQALGGSEAPIEVILVVDTVNTGAESVVFERQQIDKFLRANGGHLAHRTALAIFTDTGTKVQGGFSTDGNALADSLEKFAPEIRTVARAAGFYGAAERFQLSTDVLGGLAAREAPRPGRKIILWVSPGWPLLTGADAVLSSKQQKQIFGDIVNLSTQLLQARIALYSVNPLGTVGIGMNTFSYGEFVKGVSKPDQAYAGDLALQVIATQSGGLVPASSNDVASLLQECMADTEAYYEISFDPAPADKKDEYHHLEIKLAKPGLTARTRQGYYAQPSPHN